MGGFVLAAGLRLNGLMHGETYLVPDYTAGHGRHPVCCSVALWCMTDCTSAGPRWHFGLQSCLLRTSHHVMLHGRSGCCINAASLVSSQGSLQNVYVKLWSQPKASTDTESRNPFWNVTCNIAPERSLNSHWNVIATASKAHLAPWVNYGEN